MSDKRLAVIDPKRKFNPSEPRPQAVIRGSKCFDLSDGRKQRLQRLTNGSFLEVQFLRFADQSAVIHDGPRRA
jgi:hypothetical protein